MGGARITRSKIWEKVFEIVGDEIVHGDRARG
jgi:hypothetical protein